MRNLITPWHRFMVLLGIIASLIVLVPAQTAGASSTIRPISDFVNTQGTFCIPNGSGGCLVFVPPVANFIGWTDPLTNPQRAISVDYAGLSDKVPGHAGAFGTTTTGTIVETPLADGTAEVDVHLHTTNGLTYAIGCATRNPTPQFPNCDFGSGPLLFGHRALDVFNGLDPTLGTSDMEVRFINTAPGAPLPDLLQLLGSPQPLQAAEYLSIRAQATGTLRPAFGVPDGTAGKAETTQSGLLFNTSAANQGQSVVTCSPTQLKCSFPAQFIFLHAAGR
jgi:hypothetical protein